MSAARETHALTLALRRTGAQKSAQRGEAAEDLLPLVYAELRRLAQAEMRRLPAGQTIQATALVHEAWLRVIGKEDPGWESRGHFFGAAAQAMRRILVEGARRKGSLKRGSERADVDPDEVELTVEPAAENILAVDSALARLEAREPRIANVVSLRFFAGLSMHEIASILGISRRTVDREWSYARAFLQREVDEATS